MKFNFRKIGSVLASVAMIGSTAGIAAAAAYPGAFTGNSGNDVAIVVGGSAAGTDFVAATDIGKNLNSAISASIVGGGDVTISGESKALFTSSSRIYLNSSINTNKGILTSSDLPTILKDGEFNGFEDSDYTQTLVMGSNPKVVFGKQPTSDDDPITGISLGSTATTQYLYNATVTFSTAVQFNHSDSEGEDIVLFGQKFTVASATTGTKLVLLKSSKSLDLSVGGNTPNPSETVVIEGITYTIELVAADDDSAIIRVTDDSGASSQKTVNEAGSKKIQGLEVSIKTVDESSATNMLIAEVLVGSSKVTLQSDEQVKIGSGNDAIEGTNVHFIGGVGAMTKLVVQVSAEIDDEDAITPSQAFVDPVFGSFKVDFPGLNIADDDTANRETITIKNAGSDKMTVKFTNYNGDTPTGSINWVYNKSDSQGGGMKLADSNSDPIIIVEGAAINQSQRVMIGNEDTGGLYEITTLTNTSTAFELIMTDVFSGSSDKVTDSTGDGTATINLEGKEYTVTYNFVSSKAQKARTIRLNYPDSTSNKVIVYPTIETSKGANFAFYEPVTIDLGNWDGANNAATALKFPDGDGYGTDVAIATVGDQDEGNFSVAGTMLGTTANDGVPSTTVSIGDLTYNFTWTAKNTTKIYMQTTATGANIVRPAIVLFEEQEEDTDQYNVVVILLDVGYDGDSAGIGITDVHRTWGADGSNGDSDAWDDIQLESDEDLYKDMDLWGTIITVDKSDSDQSTAVISYPDDQVFAQVYVSSVDASISTGDGGVGNVVPVYDNEASKISGKNLIVVGGSCVNTVAAELLGASGPLCGADFTANTGIGAGEYMVETFSRTGGKIATLVAGYHAADTTAASTALTTRNPDITVGIKYKGDSSGTFGPVA